MEFRFEIVVALPREPLVDLERGAKREAPSRHRTIRADNEGERAEQTRRDPRQRPALADRFTREIDSAGSERPEAAVRGPLMVERRRRGKVAALDERHPPSARGRLVRRHEPMDAAADDEQVERGRTQCLEVARAHVGELYWPEWPMPRLASTGTSISTISTSRPTPPAPGSVGRDVE